MSLPELPEMIEGGYVARTEHPECPGLWIHNYTPKAQFKRMWNETTMQCRGLITLHEQVVSRPFRKFFNLGEHDGPVPEGPFDVYEKLDGSLGVSYFMNGVPRIATRGSFTSDQAKWATRYLLSNHAAEAQRMDPQYTYLFEIIYPENRIVVDYGSREELALLAVIHTESGVEQPRADVERWGFPLVRAYGSETDPQSLAAREEPNAEGFVIHWPGDGLRLKVKFAEYVRLHRLLTGVTPRFIWEQLRDGNDIDVMKANVPEEFAAWIDERVTALRGQYRVIETAALEAFRDLGDRKRNAELYKQQPWPQILFAMLDGKPYDGMIWKLLYPPPARAFRMDDTE